LKKTENLFCVFESDSPSPSLRFLPCRLTLLFFAQIISGLYPSEFARLAEAFPTSKPTRGLSHYDQFLALCFGQLTYRESLRDVVACLNSRKPLLYHLGFRGRISRTNLAYANKHRDWRLYQAVAELLMRRAARLYQTECWDADLPNMVFALDSSIISLALNLFPWGFYARTRKAALKLHLLLSLKGQVPAWGAITDPHVADLRMLDQVPIYPGAYYIMDRGYMDFVRLLRFHKAGAFFVVRCKEPVSFKVCHRASVDKTKGLKCDQTVRLKSNWSAKSYPEPLRRIRVYDPEHKNMIVLLTNDFSLSAEIIAELYKRRWQVELFFKWIKQHLRIRSFFGRSENAVRGQIWTAICAYLLVAILRKQNELSKSLNEILQIVSVSIFDQLPVTELLGPERPVGQSIQNERDAQKCFSFNIL